MAYSIRLQDSRRSSCKEINGSQADAQYHNEDGQNELIEDRLLTVVLVDSSFYYGLEVVTETFV
jgi:hypothetical protein